MSTSAAADCGVTQPSRPTLEALYAINKRAKQLSRSANADYRADCLGIPSSDGLRKEAIYEVKRRVLEELQDEATCVELHDIRGTEYYCFHFGRWSFHTPVDDFDGRPRVDGRRELSDFNPTHSAVRTDMSVSAALAHFEETYDINANDHLPRRHIIKGADESTDIGWGILAD